jgi:hypothetical protein
MRLGQLARKLDLRPAEIIEFLAAKNIHQEDDVNAKLADDYVALVFQQFAPEKNVEKISDGTAPVGIPAELTSDEQVFDGNIETASIEETEVTEKSEVIKAPKVELSGLKVLGKIELPETKKKQADSPQENSELERPKEFSRERRSSDYKRTQRQTKNPIALQREKEALAEQNKKEKELEHKKEKRTQNYLKKVKAHQPTKAAKIINEDAEEMTAADLAEPPKTWMGKFIRWLTT